MSKKELVITITVTLPVEHFSEGAASIEEAIETLRGYGRAEVADIEIRSNK